MPCCCKNPDHEAVASQADSAEAPQANRIGDRGFEDDKVALQKWRKQQTGATAETSKTNEKKGAADNSNSGSDSSGDSDSSDTYHLESNQAKSPVKVSTDAVHAWQQSPQKPSQASSPPAADLLGSFKKPSLRAELRSPFEVSFDRSSSGSQRSVEAPRPIYQLQQPVPQALTQTTPEATKNPSPRSQNIFRTALLDEQEETPIVTPETSPTTPTLAAFSPARARSIPSNRLQQEHHKLDALVHNAAAETSHDDDRIPPPKSPPKSSSPLHRAPRQHDHEGLRDQLIRDVVLQQQGSSAASLEESENQNEDDQDRVQGQVFLHLNPQDNISPRSSLEDTHDDTDGISDIFSDPALEEVANSLANDSESRERYILACRLLRARITQPNPPDILPMERELLQGLRDRFRSSRAGGSAVAFEALSKLLEEDEDEEEGIVPLEENEDEEMEGIVPLGNSRSRSSGTAQHEDMEIDHDVSMESEFMVASIREEETGFNTVWRDEKNTKAIPQLVEDDDAEYQAQPPTGEEPKKTLIRLDGWNFSLREKHPFEIFGLDQDTPQQSRVLTPALMEALRGFFPYAVSEDNFWLKFSLVRDGASLRSLLRQVMASQHTILCIETNDGEVFGSFCSTPWRNNGQSQKWFGTGEAFLWKLKQSRYVSDPRTPISNEMEVYPFTGHDDMVQYCTNTTMAVGGGNWKDAICPYPGEPHGIALLVDGDLEGGETNSCATFANPRLYGRSTSNNEFRIHNLECWTLTPMNTVHAAEQLERQKYFIHEHAQPTSPVRPGISPRRGRGSLSPR